MNPLADYLQSAEVSQAAFAARLSRLHGARVMQQQVSRWVTGATPSLSYRRLISRATGGKVPVSAWPAVPSRAA